MDENGPNWREAIEIRTWPAYQRMKEVRANHDSDPYDYQYAMDEFIKSVEEA